MPRDVALRTLPADPTAVMHAVTKKYCDANTSGVGLVVTWAGSKTTDGIARTGGSGDVKPSCVTTRIYIQQPLKITDFYCNIPTTGTYNLYVTSGPYDSAMGTPGTDILFALIEDVVVTEAGDVHFTPTTARCFLPGVYYLTFQREEGGASWSLATNNDGVSLGFGCALFYTDYVYFDGTVQAYYSTVVYPLFITAYKGTLSAT